MQPGGILVLSGILNPEFPKIKKIYEDAGLKLLRSWSKKEWRSGSFQRVHLDTTHRTGSAGAPGWRSQDAPHSKNFE
jgi:hypothetical protein